MKRLSLLMFSLLLLCAVCACRGDPVTLPDAAFGVSFVSEELPDNSRARGQVTIPVLEDYPDGETAEIFRTDALEYALEVFARKGPSSGAAAEYCYEIPEAILCLAAPQLVSVRIGAVLSAEGALQEERFAYTFNYDLSSGTVLQTEDIIADYPAFRRLFESGAFSQDFGYPSLEKEVSYADMIAQYRTEYGIYPYVYFTEGRIGVLIDVVPGLDGYAGFSADIRDVRRCLHTENPTLAVLCGLSAKS